MKLTVNGISHDPLRSEAMVSLLDVLREERGSGFGVTSASFAIETHMQRIAGVLGIDPWELRLRNATRAGDMTPTGVRVPDPSAVSTLLAAADAAGVRLPDSYRSMSDVRGVDDDIPNHLKDVVSARRPAEELEI